MENSTKALIKKGMLYGMIAFYIFGGYNHFRDPAFYIPLIPPYLAAWAVELNLLSGVFEIGFSAFINSNTNKKICRLGYCTHVDCLYS